ncbi:transposase [Streptococcus pneumoniae]|nr:transposase [Streptococcus pneumoniae]
MIKTYNSRCSVLPPKKLDRKNLTFWGVFIMKLSYDDKVQIYELRKQGYSLEKLSNKFGINNSNLRYMIKLIDR